MSKIDVSKCELIYNDGRCFAGQMQGIGNDCHKSDYCKYNSNCYYKQRDIWMGVANKYKQCLNEIEKVVANNISYMDTASTTCAMEKILQLIKQAKEGGE